MGVRAEQAKAMRLFKPFPTEGTCLTMSDGVAKNGP